MYVNPNYKAVQLEEAIEVDDKEAQTHFDEFYEDVFTELGNFGEIEEMHVTGNLGDHLTGNLYVKFRNEEDAEKALRALHGRFYAGRPVTGEFSPVTDFREVCSSSPSIFCTSNFPFRRDAVSMTRVNVLEAGTAISFTQCGRRAAWYENSTGSNAKSLAEDLAAPLAEGVTTTAIIKNGVHAALVALVEIVTEETGKEIGTTGTIGEIEIEIGSTEETGTETGGGTIGEIEIGSPGIGTEMTEKEDEKKREIKMLPRQWKCNHPRPRPSPSCRLVV